MLIRHVHCALENRRSVELHFESGELHSNLVGAVQCIPWKFNVERLVTLDQYGLRMEGFHLARSHSVVEKEESELSYARSAAELHCRPQREAQEPSTEEFSEQF